MIRLFGWPECPKEASVEFSSPGGGSLNLLKMLKGGHLPKNIFLKGVAVSMRTQNWALSLAEAL